MKKNFFIKTLGCKTNQIESALIEQIMTENGFTEVQNISNADYFILNSCSVTHIADSKNISYLRRAKRENPNITTVITGCMAQLEKENLIKENIADIVIGNYEKNDIANIIKRNEKYIVSDIFAHNDFRYEKIENIKRTRAQVKIQDGCNNRCSYCTIPFARGKNRSNSVKNIIEQVNIYADKGYYEAVLTGIHIGQWGWDFKPKQKLQDLLESLENTNIHRYRLGSLNPLELDNEFLEFLSKSTKFCPHFHISLQSVCNKTLNAMNRKYSQTQIFELVENINTKFKNAYIGSDIIVGFPSESIQDFDVTYNNLKELKLTKVHVFPFSRRKGTIAYNIKEQVEDKEKKRRTDLIQELSAKKLNTFLQKNINTENEIIIEKNRDKKTNYLKGITRNYINVLINDSDEYKDTIQKIYINNISDDREKLFGKIVT